MKTGQCALCGAEVMLPEHGQPGRSESCLECQGDIHSCKQCEFYDAAVAQECREPQAEMVSDKERANFCGFFVFQGGSGERSQREQQAKDALEALFKK